MTRCCDDAPVVLDIERFRFAAVSLLDGGGNIAFERVKPFGRELALEALDFVFKMGQARGDAPPLRYMLGFLLLFHA